MFVEGEKWFAPDILWAAVDPAGADFPAQLERRFEGFYFGPAERLLKGNDDFAAGVLILCALDAIARLWTGNTAQVRARFIEVAEEMGIGCSSDFYDFFRNGLVHEARIKRGACFDKGREDLIGEVGGEFIVNPRRLLGETRKLLKVLLNDDCRFSKNAMPLLRSDIDQA